MSLGNDLTPVVREESILNGGAITPATRLEYFLAKAAEGGGGGGGGSVYSPVLAQTTKSVLHEWVSSFSGGPILEDANYRVIVNGTTYEPLTGTAGEDGYICLGNTYVDDSDPSGDYGFGIFYKESQLSAWLETGDSMTMQIDQIIQAIPVPTPAAADTGKVLTANNGAAEWVAGGGGASLIVGATFVDDVITLDKTYKQIRDALLAGSFVVIQMPNVDYSGAWFANGLAFVTQIYYVAESQYYCINITGDLFAYNALATLSENGYPSLDMHDV